MAACLSSPSDGIELLRLGERQEDVRKPNDVQLAAAKLVVS